MANNENQPKNLIIQYNVPLRRCATITLNRPRRGNALTPGMVLEFTESLQRMAVDDGIACVVLTGSGKYFCTGMDLSQSNTSSMSKDGALPDIFAACYSFPKPIIGKINGPAIGGGNGLLFLCDIRVALDTSYIWFSEVKRGLVPAIITAYITPQLGSFKTRQYMLTGEKVSSSQLYKDGQISAVVSSQQHLDDKTVEYVKELLSSAPIASQDIKRAVLFHTEGTTHSERVEYSSKLFGKMMRSKEAAYGLGCFRQKKTPDWTAKL